MSLSLKHKFALSFLTVLSGMTVFAQDSYFSAVNPALFSYKSSDVHIKSPEKLNDLSDVEAFIDENNHLPDVPSAKDVAESGYSQHEMNMVLLKKIEELTLYIIQQQKEIEELKSKIK